ncbi:MAG: 2-C-methyl-D-erythritol 2,4-cyclodiphosphate synthase [Oscillospiraceae bacterium]|nr:2-C-methyl-D-erythritol 2,4-cyclodiphosphate synthase [Clostridiaceae bacterium]MDO4494986.1 2-C-methyl-D-erythritol 2,4-cyclodiphosphate synthase [Clostridiaceae bacterium]MDY5947844.1 2-C-methyl-D-erythritol 2,4-cyclodiphosphate synthase [Oscillospiraceae bacterium]
MLRIGQGYDVHRLVSGRRLVVGGVEIPHETGLLGHSDADVLLHAISDALLGAAAMGDIGCLFPDNDSRFKDADSLVLLSAVAEKLKESGFSIVNIDCTLIAQKPKMRPYIDEMRANIARACGISVEFVSVKATTEEGLGFSGREEGMAAQAICLIEN